MFEFIYEYVERETFIKYFRLGIFVAVYILARGYYSEWAKNRAVKKQIQDDEREKLEAPAKKQKELEESAEKLNAEAQTFGWGKKTRKNVKLQQQILQQTLDEMSTAQQTAYDAAEDHDIEDLLED